MIISVIIVRRLTPIECFRLQGFLNDEVKLEGLSDTQRYKLAGNGQSVNVVKKIFEKMFEGEMNE
jgi:DNA (cytosine-5)-methyltransferase 1